MDKYLFFCMEWKFPPKKVQNFPLLWRGHENHQFNLIATLYIRQIPKSYNEYVYLFTRIKS